MSRHLISLFLSCLLATPASAAIYRYTDEHGNQVYTNRPPQGGAGEEVQLRQPNLIPPPVYQPMEPVGTDEEERPFTGYQRLEITGLPEDGVTRGSQLSVQVAIEPPLLKEHRIRLLMDGRTVGGPGRNTSFSVGNLERGTHHLQVVIESDEGLVQSSPSAEVTRHQVNLNSPAFGGGK